LIFNQRRLMKKTVAHKEKDKNTWLVVGIF
jgi:hypothetical protein